MQQPSKTPLNEDITRTTALDEFNEKMEIRLQTIKDKACCDGHLSTPMYVDGIRLACCGGSGSTCKIKELDFVTKELQKSFIVRDRLRDDLCKVAGQARHLKRNYDGARQQLEELQQRYARLEERNRQLEEDLSFQIKPTVKRNRVDEEFLFNGRHFRAPAAPAPMQIPNFTINNTINNYLHIQIMKNNDICKNGVKLLMDACKGIGLFDAAAALLQNNQSSANNALLLLKASDVSAYQASVIESLKPCVSQLPAEEKKQVETHLPTIKEPSME